MTTEPQQEQTLQGNSSSNCDAQTKQYDATDAGGLPPYAGAAKLPSLYESEVIADKQLRKDTDEIIQRIKAQPSSRERSLAITKLQEGVMWLGMDLKRLGEANPYPNSYNPSNTKIEPTADGLKF